MLKARTRSWRSKRPSGRVRLLREQFPVDHTRAGGGPKAGQCPENYAQAQPNRQRHPGRLPTDESSQHPTAFLPGTTGWDDASPASNRTLFLCGWASETGDVITGVNGRDISTENDALGFYENLKSADDVKLNLKRGGRQRTIEYSIK